MPCISFSGNNSYKVEKRGYNIIHFYNKNELHIKLLLTVALNSQLSQTIKYYFQKKSKRHKKLTYCLRWSKLGGFLFNNSILSEMSSVKYIHYTKMKNFILNELECNSNTIFLLRLLTFM